MISLDPVKQRAATIAVSLASVPLLVSMDRVSLPSGVIEAIFFASFTSGSIT